LFIILGQVLQKIDNLSIDKVEKRSAIIQDWRFSYNEYFAF